MSGQLPESKQNLGGTAENKGVYPMEAGADFPKRKKKKKEQYPHTMNKLLLPFFPENVVFL